MMICGGLLLLAAALLPAGWNLLEDQQAAQASEQVLRQMEQPPPAEADPPEEPEEVVPAYVLDPDMEMPETEVDGHLYIGVLEIPALELELPVMSRWSYPDLKIAPCRYQGSAYQGDLILLAHNYSRHFGQIHSLTAGDVIRFTDADGNRFTYEVSLVEQLERTAIEEMESGDWDLTLFTCTVGGAARVTVRCRQTDDIGADR